MYYGLLLVDTTTRVGDLREEGRRAPHTRACRCARAPPMLAFRRAAAECSPPPARRAFAHGAGQGRHQGDLGNSRKRRGRRPRAKRAARR